MESNWRAQRAKLGLSACSTNWCILVVKSICPSSSSGWIIQVTFNSYFGRLIIHPAEEFHHHTMIPWSEIKQFVFLSTGVRTSACYFYSSQSIFITLPLEEGSFSLSIKQVINSAPFLEDVVLYGQIDLRRTFTFWAIEPPFLLHVASITVRGVL